MQKQDIARARTTQDLERKYKFGESFAEAFGLAKDAQDAADKAQQAAEEAKSAAAGVDEALTQEEIFNRLTNDGEDQGIYLKDGKIYINASYILTGVLLADLIKSGTLDASKVTVSNLSADSIKSGTLDASKVIIANLIANTILSKDSFGGSMEILGGVFRLYQDETNMVEVTVEYEGYPVMRMTLLTDGVETTRLEMGPEGFQVLDVSGDIPSVKFALQLDADGDPAITCNDTYGNSETLKIAWKDNGDGTYSLIGQ